MDLTLLLETLMTSQERHCKKEGNLKTTMAMGACAMKEWSRLQQMMGKAGHSKDTDLRKKKEKKLSIKSRLKSLTTSKNSRFSNLSLGLTISTIVSMMETQMSLVDHLGHSK